MHPSIRHTAKYENRQKVTACDEMSVENPSSAALEVAAPYTSELVEAWRQYQGGYRSLETLETMGFSANACPSHVLLEVAVFQP